MSVRVFLVSGQDRSGVEGYLQYLVAGLQSPEEALLGRVTVSAEKREGWLAAMAEMATPPMPFAPNPTKVVIVRDLQTVKTLDISFELEKALRAAEAWAKTPAAGSLVLIGEGSEKIDTPGTPLDPLTSRLKSKRDHRVFKVFSVWQSDLARKEIKEVLAEFTVELKPRLIAVIHELVEGNVSLVRPLAEKLALLQGQGTQITSKTIRDLMGVRQYVSLPAVVEALHQADRKEAYRTLSGVLMTMGPWEVAAKLGGLLHKDAVYEAALHELSDVQMEQLLCFKEGGHKRLYYWKQRHEKLRPHYYLDLVNATVALRYRITEGELRTEEEQRRELLASVLEAVR